MSAATDPKYRLSKSKIAAFEHCAKRLWLQVHRRDAAKFDDATLARFKFGHDVGEKARFGVPDGILVETGFDMAAAIARTQELLAAPDRRPIFEATFQYQNVLCRVDILLPDEDGAWRAIEVKASSRAKFYQYADLATQIWIMTNCGVKISRGIIRHLARPVPWWRPDIAAVTFRDTDITEQVKRALVSRSTIAADATRVIQAPEPERPIGMHCYKPFACEFREHCQAGHNLSPVESEERLNLGRMTTGGF